MEVLLRVDLLDSDLLLLYLLLKEKLLSI